ncbi:MFS transporter [Streptomyces ureilyticus]|uniref:MFS transporter n=1 Tax=Streptomyces ureilyticus TaxID=1775131 RepID=A0ABX0DNY7_9ACTN|nr:MFS transporter [Streptomyces ureilyticus]NGO43585.1 MFS transporter [Streptomyces ureilyticus]
MSDIDSDIDITETLLAPARKAPPSTAPPRRVWTVVLAGLGALLCALDVVVVATALPALQADFGASLSQLEWTINAYNLVFACLTLTGAALGDRFGRRRMYVAGLALFTLASAWAALAGGAGELIAARAVQGAGAAVLLPLTLTLISEAFPAEKRGVAIGLWGGVSGLGVAAGPVLGGAVTDGLSWQWIFWLNVPLGLVMLPLAAMKLRESYGPRPQLDIVGLVLAAVGLTGLAWAPVRAPEAGWGSAEVLFALGVGAVFVAAFLGWEESGARYPMLPLAHFRRRGFSTANGAVFLMFVSLLGALFMISQLFQVGLGNSPLEAGLRILVWTGTPLLVAPVAGALADRFGNRPFMLTGLVLQAVGLGLMAWQVEPGVGYDRLVLPLIIAGVGISMVFPTVANAVSASVPPAEVGVASGVNNALRELGGVFGVAVAAAVFVQYGGYDSAESFIDGCAPALWVSAGVSAAGAVVASFAPSKHGS